MPTALIADDETHLSRYLKDQLKLAWPELEILALCANGVEAAQQIDALNPDVAFLDIQMPGLTGLEVAQGVEGETLCVFVTAYDQYAVQAFDDGAVDYMLKPINPERLRKCVSRVQARLSGTAPQSEAAKASADPSPAPSPAPALASVLQRLLQSADPQTLSALVAATGSTGANGHLRYVRAHERSGQGEQVLQIDVNEVLYFDAADKYTCVVLPGSEKLLRTSVSELEAQLDPQQFKRIHRSTLVNLAHVHASHRDESGRLFVRIKNHSRALPVSRAYSELFSRM
jgi:DNA-binding LytR/AlgR family response regulator